FLAGRLGFGAVSVGLLPAGFLLLLAFGLGDRIGSLFGRLANRRTERASTEVEAQAAARLRGRPVGFGGRTAGRFLDHLLQDRFIVRLR
ncbi:hypothetical protein GUH07_00010, partial [Xanthomonas citri pv. citri]|nr:hypothetical protein [Xanthomonas citri pv. citri]